MPGESGGMPCGLASILLRSWANFASGSSSVSAMAKARLGTGMKRRHEKYKALIDRCKALPPTPTAVAHPCDASSLRSVVEAARLGLIAPVLVGPVQRIRDVAMRAMLDIAGYRLIDAAFSEESAQKAVAEVRGGRAAAVMKGSLHTDELMHAIVRPDSGLRAKRRISHCFVVDVPRHAAPLIITDAVVNIAPTLSEKVDIVQNAIDLAHALSITDVRVAILSALETVNPEVRSTLEAAAICKMADRKQIMGAMVDGPLALDNAISLEAARTKGIDSPVAGRANVLVVPDIEAGNMLVKSLTFLADADAAGIVVGARAPVILTSRADSLISRLASCAVATLVIQRAAGTGGSVPPSDDRWRPNHKKGAARRKRGARSRAHRHRDEPQPTTSEARYQHHVQFEPARQAVPVLGTGRRQEPG